MSNRTSNRLSRLEVLAAGGLTGLKSSASGNSLRGIAETAFAAQSKAVAESQAAKAGNGKAETSQKPKKRKPAAPKSLVAQFVEREAKPGEIVFVLPLPPEKISPNGRGHWGAKARAVKAYRDQCAWIMRQWRINHTEAQLIQGRVIIDLEFYLCRLANDKTNYYPKDEDNARGAMKAAQDALKDAEIISGDGKRLVGIGETKLYTRAKEHQGFTCVVMTIRKES